MTRIDELGLRLLALAALGKRLDELTASTKDELRQEISPGTTLRPVLGGSQAGSVSYSLPRPRARVTDPDALGAWTAQHHPTEAEHIWRCRPAFSARLLALAEAAEQPIGLGGEVDDPPRGIIVAVGGPVIRVLVDPDRLADIVTGTAVRDVLEVRA